MQGTPGVGLLVSGCVFLVVLGAPAMLMASEEPVTSPSGQPSATPAAPAPPVSADEATAPPQLEPATAPAKGSAPRGARAAATRTVAMRDNKFVPRNITIAVGDTVRWDNQGKVEHNAIGDNDKFKTPTIGPGETSQHTFSTGGKYPYFCSIHFGMKGKIQVGSSGGGSGGGGSDANGNGTGGTSAGGSTGGTSGGTGGTGSIGGSSSTGGSSSSSSLPATGEDLPWLALLGYVVLMGGALLRLFVFGRE